MGEADISLDALRAACQRERDAFQRTGEVRSPACVELFRRAFAAEQEAWSSIYTVFHPQIARQATRVVKANNLDESIEPEEVVQETFAAFARFAPRRPDLVASEHLGPLVGYLQQCVKTAALTILRKQHAPPSHYLDAQADAGPSYSLDEDRVARQALYARLFELVVTEEERIVATARFLGNLKPRYIQRDWPGLFADVKSVYDVVQRLTRRLRKDAIMQQLCDDLAPGLRQKLDSDAFLQMSDEHVSPSTSSMDAPCELSEAQLLDYVSAIASAELRIAVERSPACRAAAQALSESLAPFMGVLYRLACPSTHTLTSYQERSLGSTEQLLLHRHVQACVLCQREIALLNELDALLEPPSTIVRRIIEAVFVGALQAAPQLRGGGGVLRFRTPQIAITMSLREGLGKPSTWTLRGELRTPEGTLARGLLEMADIAQLVLGDSASQQATIEDSSSFVFAGLGPGRYRLRLLTPEEEIVIRDLAVGDDD